MESIFQILYEVFHYTIISYFSLTVLASPAFFIALRYFAAFPFRILITAFFWIFWNAFFPTVFNTLLLIVTRFSLLHPENAFAPMVFTLFPMPTCVSLLLFLNALVLIAVTLYVCP